MLIEFLFWYLSVFIDMARVDHSFVPDRTAKSKFHYALNSTVTGKSCLSYLSYREVLQPGQAVRVDYVGSEGVDQDWLFGEKPQPESRCQPVRKGLGASVRLCGSFCAKSGGCLGMAYCHHRGIKFGLPRDGLIFSVF